MVLEWMQFLLGTGLLVLGMAVFVLELIGIFKFKYVLNRMHAAAIGDTFGLGISLLGLMILSGFKFVTERLLFKAFAARKKAPLLQSPSTSICPGVW